MAASNAPFAVEPCPADGAPVVRAASLLRTALEVAKVRQWTQLNGELPARLLLTDEQVDLINEHAQILVGMRAEIGANVTVSGCGQCGRWAYVGSSSPSKCWLTPGCPGVVKRALVAKRVAPAREADQVADEDAEPDLETDDLPITDVTVRVEPGTSVTAAPAEPEPIVTWFADDWLP